MACSDTAQSAFACYSYTYFQIQSANKAWKMHKTGSVDQLKDNVDKSSEVYAEVYFFYF